MAQVRGFPESLRRIPGRGGALPHERDAAPADWVFARSYGPPGGTNYIKALDREIVQHIQTSELQRPYQILQTIPRVKAASGLLAEFSSGMKVFGSGAKCSSWAGVAPENNESAGRKRMAPTLRGNPSVRATLVDLHCQLAVIHQIFHMKLRFSFWEWETGKVKIEIDVLVGWFDLARENQPQFRIGWRRREVAGNPI